MVTQPYGPQPFPRSIPTGSITEPLQQVCTHLYVLLRRQAPEQVVALNDHADPAAQLEPG